jgi:hypothetical protein
MREKYGSREKTGKNKQSVAVLYIGARERPGARPKGPASWIDGGKDRSSSFR